MKRFSCRTWLMVKYLSFNSVNKSCLFVFQNHAFKWRVNARCIVYIRYIDVTNKHFHSPTLFYFCFSNPEATRTACMILVLPDRSDLHIRYVYRLETFKATTFGYFPAVCQNIETLKILGIHSLRSCEVMEPRDMCFGWPDRSEIWPASR